MADEEDGQDTGEQGLYNKQWVMTVEPLPEEDYKQGGPVCDR